MVPPFLTTLNFLYQSTAISFAVYHSNWLDANVHDRKALLLILLRAQKPLQISAYKIITVSLKGYTKVEKVKEYLPYQI